MKLLDVSKTKYHGKNITDCSVPPELRVKIKTDVEFLDYVLGGGLTPSTCWMVTGDPGCGKTTLMLTAANALTKRGHVVLYNGREESVYQVKIATERLGLSDGFIFGEDIFVGDVVEHADKLVKGLEQYNAGKPVDKQRRVILMVDSLQCLDSGKYDTGRRTKNTPLQCASELIAWAKRTHGIMAFINHVTKNGNFAGDNALLHAVDGRLHFGFDRNKKSETYLERVLSKTKDRFGPAAAPMVLDMGEGGVLFKKDVEVSEEDADDVDDEAAE